jgi:hypothetical protein
MKPLLRLLTPWHPIDPAIAAIFEVEFALELGIAHPLSGIPANAIARRIDGDDVLFQLQLPVNNYAVVRLNWARKERYPNYQVYKDEEQLMEQCIRPAHEEYGGD